MYQGKFDKKYKSSTTSTSELVAARNSERAAKEAARQNAPQQRTPVRETAAPAKRQASAAVREVPAAKQAQPASRKQAVVQEEPRRRGPRLGGVIFYTVYFMFIFLFCVGIFLGMQWFHGWLCDYEASQPTVKSKEVFQQLFTDPDWGTLYDSLGIEDSMYESKEAFVAYMEEKVGDSELTYLETSAGLSGGKKYFVKLDNETLASFTLVTDGDTSNLTEIHNWELGKIELFFERGEGFRIQSQQGHTVYVNGVALTDDHTIQYSTIKGEGGSFLPAGATVPHTSIQEISGLLMRPTVTIFDEKNKEMDVIYDEEQGMFIEQTVSNTISEEERNVALKAIKVYAEFQIKEADSNGLAKYFDSSNEAYKNILKTDRTWTKDNRGYSFSNDSVTHYNRYSDSLFSVYVSTDMNIKLTDGGTQDKPIHSTLLFSKQNGSWKVIKMTNEDIGETVGKIRLTFKNAGGDILSSDFYDSDLTNFSTPMMSVPEGKVFAGWVREIVNNDGSKTLELVFQPDENGEVSLPRGTVLIPMVLSPLFEDAASAAVTEGA